MLMDTAVLEMKLKTMCARLHENGPDRIGHQCRFRLCCNHWICLHLSAKSQYSKTCVKWPPSQRPKIGFQDRLSLNEGQK